MYGVWVEGAEDDRELQTDVCVPGPRVPCEAVAVMASSCGRPLTPWGQATWGKVSYFSPYYYYCETFMFICDKFIILSFIESSYNPNAIIFKYYHDSNRTKIDISPFFWKNTCIWEKGERTILKKWREWLQTCYKLFPVSHLQWGHFPAFLDTISSLSRSDILKSKIFSKTNSGLTSEVREIASIYTKNTLWKKYKYVW